MLRRSLTRAAAVAALLAGALPAQDETKPEWRRLDAEELVEALAGLRAPASDVLALLQGAGKPQVTKTLSYLARVQEDATRRAQRRRAIEALRDSSGDSEHVRKAIDLLHRTLEENPRVQEATRKALEAWIRAAHGKQDAEHVRRAAERLLQAHRDPLVQDAHKKALEAWVKALQGPDAGKDHHAEFLRKLAESHRKADPLELHKEAIEAWKKAMRAHEAGKDGHVEQLRRLLESHAKADPKEADRSHEMRSGAHSHRDLMQQVEELRREVRSLRKSIEDLRKKARRAELR